MRTGCGHWFCRDCLLGALPERAADARCPKCLKYVDATGVRAAAAPAAPVKKRRRRKQDDDEDWTGGRLTAAGSRKRRFDEESACAEAGAGADAGAGAEADEEADAEAELRFESKLKVLVEELCAIRDNDASAKALVFSQARRAGVRYPQSPPRVSAVGSSRARAVYIHHRVAQGAVGPGKHRVPHD